MDQNISASNEGTELDATEAAILRMLEQDDEDTPETAPESNAEPEEGEDADDAVDETADDEGESDDSSPEETSAKELDFAQTKHKVKVRGQELEVDYTELLNGYSRTEDYTRDKMAVAEEKRQIAAERAAYVQKLEAAEAVLAERHAEPDWDHLRSTLTDDEFADAHAQWSIQQRNVERVRQEREREQQKLQHDQMEHYRAHIQAEQSKMLQLLPDWADEAVRTKAQQELASYAMQLGFTPEQIAGINDSRMMLVLHKAAQMDKLERKARTAKPVVAGKPTVPSVAPSKPKSVARVGTPSAQQEYNKSRQALRKTGSLESAAAALVHLLD